jgi:hypothetical protein
LRQSEITFGMRIELTARPGTRVDLVPESTLRQLT